MSCSGPARRSASLAGAQFTRTGRVCDADVIRHIDNVSGSWWVYAGATKGATPGVGVTDGVTHWNIAPVGWTFINAKLPRLSIGDINGVVFLNHPELGAYFWDGDATHKMTRLPNWLTNWHCSVMRAHKNWLMALNIDDDSGNHPETGGVVCVGGSRRHPTRVGADAHQ